MIAKKTINSSATFSDGKAVKGSLIDRYDRQFGNSARDLSGDRVKEIQTQNGNHDDSSLMLAIKELTLKNSHLSKEVDALKEQLFGSEKQQEFSKEVIACLTQGNKKNKK